MTRPSETGTTLAMLAGPLAGRTAQRRAWWVPVAAAGFIILLQNRDVLASPPAAVKFGSHQSHGHPNAGRLVGAQPWHDTLFAKRLSNHAAAAAFAMPGLLTVVQHAARMVAARHPHSMLRVGDFSLEHGGPISGHHSHQNGRDVDVGFYALDGRNRSVTVSRFLAFDGAGQAVGMSDIRFDEARNWALLNALLNQPRAEVRAIFVASWLRSRLLRYGETIGSSKSTLERAAAMMMQPPNAEPHDDHFHIRIGCVASQRATICRDDSRATALPHRSRPFTPADAASDRLSTTDDP